jgi:hypothetical protein
MKNLKNIVRSIVKKIIILTHYFWRINFKNHAEEKKIIICFDGIFPHGGLVDRLKGIVSFYEISTMLSYKFYIQFDHPFDLNVFLKPNKVDWQIDRKEISWNPTRTKFLYLVNKFDINPLHIIKSSKATNFIVYANIDYLKTIHPNSNSDEIEKIWRDRFNELFLKSAYLSNKLDVIEKEKYITCHSRFTSLMGDFVDTTIKLIPDDKKLALLNKLLVIVEGIVNESKYKCYVLSDSVKFLNFIKERVSVYMVEGDPFHMDDFNNESTLDNHLKTMIDFFVIVNSEAVYFLKVDQMHHSSFSKYASIIGNKPFTMITNS